MSTVIYLGNQQVRIVVGQGAAKKINVTHAYSAMAPEGSIINGLIMDSDAFVEFLREFLVKNSIPTKEVFLVINSTKFIGKIIETPAMKNSKMIDYIAREFADLKKSDDEFYGYIPLGGTEGKINRIYAESITPDFIEDYVNIFNQIGVQIKAIYSGESSLIRLVDQTVAADLRTFLVVIAEGMTLTSLLYVNKSFYHFTTTRSFNEPGSEDYGYDVARSVSQIIQFMQAHQIEYPLEAIKLAGFDDIDVSNYNIIIRNQGIQIPVSSFDCSIFSEKLDVREYMNVLGGLLVSGKSQNFLLTYMKNSKTKGASNMSSDGRKAWRTIGIVFALMIVLLTASFVLKNISNKELDDLLAYNNSPAVQDQLEEYDMADTQYNFLMNQFNAIETIDENMYTYPVCNDNILKIFDQCAFSLVALEFESYDTDTGMTTIKATSENVDDINKFIAKLLEKEEFYNVDYTGYTFDDETQLWDIHVTCTLAESAGRE